MKWILMLFGLFLAINLASAQTNVSSCKLLNITNEVYDLNQSVQNNITCFNITANGITLDGHGYEINYSNSSVNINNIYGIAIKGANHTTIQNMNITEGKLTGNVKGGITIISAQNITIKNCSFLTWGSTISAAAGSKSIFLQTKTDNITIINNVFNYTNGLSLGGAIYQTTASRNITIFNNTFYSKTDSATLSINAINLTVINYSVIFQNTFISQRLGVSTMGITEISTGSLSDNVQIYNNTFTATYRTGGGAMAVAGTRINVSNNTILGSGGIIINGKYCNVFNNIMNTSLSSSITDLASYSNFNGNIIKGGIDALSLSLGGSTSFVNVYNNTLNNSNNLAFSVGGSYNNISNNTFEGTTFGAISGSLSTGTNLFNNYVRILGTNAAIAISGGNFSNIYGNTFYGADNANAVCSLAGGNNISFYNNSCTSNERMSPIEISNAINWTISNNTLTCLANIAGPTYYCSAGILFDGASSTGNTFINNYITMNVTGRSCIKVSGTGVNATIQDTICNGTSGAVDYFSSSANSAMRHNVTMINVTNATGKPFTYNIVQTNNGQSTLNVYWWGNFESDYWNGTLLPNSNFSGINNATGQWMFQNITNISTGMTDRQQLRAFIANGTLGNNITYDYYNFTAQNLGVTLYRSNYNPTNNFNLVFPFSDCNSGGNCVWNCTQNYTVQEAWSIAGNIKTIGTGTMTLQNLISFSGPNRYVYVNSGCELDIIKGGGFG